MTVNTITSITEPTKVFRTGQKPILIMCDDTMDYVVKYKKYGDSTPLLFEFLAGSFLKIWELGVPDFALVQVNQDHIPMGFHSDIQPYFFNDPCFGSRYSSSYNDVNSFLFTSSNYNKQKFLHKWDLFEIALFDLWLCNEDRNHNNHNLLFDLENGNKFVPIDHQNIFNGNNLPDLSILTESESLLYSPLVKHLFTSKDFKNIQHYTQDLEISFNDKVDACKVALGQIFNQVPDSWQIDKDDWIETLDQTIFSDYWKSHAWKTFCDYLQNFIN